MFIVLTQFTVGAVGLVMVCIVFGYGEYQMTTTGDLRWALFYVPHAILLIWYIHTKYKQNQR